MYVVVRKSMLPVGLFCSMKPLFASVECNGDHKTAFKDEVKSCHPRFGDLTRFKIVVFVCLSSLSTLKHVQHICCYYVIYICITYIDNNRQCYIYIYIT